MGKRIDTPVGLPEKTPTKITVMLPLLLGFLSCALLSGKPNTAGSDPTLIGGTVSISPGVAMSQTEVTVNDWMDFIAANDFDATLFPVDSLVANYWTRVAFADLRKRDNFSHLYVKKTREHGQELPSVRLKHDYLGDSLTGKELAPMTLPITGISYEQVARFCQWKERVVNHDRDASRKIHIGLPTMEMYSQVMVVVDSLSTKHPDACMGYRFNYKHASCNNKNKILSLQGNGLMRADSYWPTGPGLYCILGNAGEMTATPGIAMGGSFRHYASEAVSYAVQSYEHPTDWLGFRFVVTTK